MVQQMKKYGNEIGARKASSMKAIRAAATQLKIMDDWFDQVADIYLEGSLKNKPFHIFNCDESGLQFVTIVTSYYNH